MANPVFSRAEAFQPRGNPYGQPAYAGQGYRAQYGVSGQPGGESGSLLDGPQGQSAERAMTLMTSSAVLAWFCSSLLPLVL